MHRFHSIIKKINIYFAGPACSDTVEPIAGVAKHFNTIIISYSAEGAVFSNRDKYPYFFRTIPENNQFRLEIYLKVYFISCTAYIT